jgi:ketosteroid isomerase-like protein
MTMAARVTRRNFMNGVAIGAGATLLAPYESMLGGAPWQNKLYKRTANKTKKRIEIMKKILSSLIIVLMSFSAMAEHHGVEKGAENADLHAAIKVFDHAYANNDVEKYFSFYADDATVYFGGETRVDVAAYHEMWTALMPAGGGVERNEASDIQVQVMPSGDVAIATSFIDNRTRAADGTTATSRAFETDVWQKIAGKWQIISLHYSGIAEEE